MDHSRSQTSYSRGPGTARSTRSHGSKGESEKPAPPEPKPYLDKMVMKMNQPLDIEGNNDYVSVTTFPDLYRYTRIKSAYEPITIPTANPHGEITPMYKTQAFEALKPIYRDEKEINSRVETFKKYHRQFLDDVLNDMEETRVSQDQRKMKYWTNSKSKLGFAGSFNTEYYRTSNQSEHMVIKRQDSQDPEVQQQATAPQLSLSTEGYSQEFGSTSDAYYDNDFEAEGGPGSSQQPSSSSQSNNRSPKEAAYDHTDFHQHVHNNPSARTSPKKPATPVPAMLDRPKKGHLPPNSSVIIKRIGYRPPNKIALFNALLETTPAPNSPRKRYGTMDIKKKNYES